jgi:hypothetical protein
MKFPHRKNWDGTYDSICSACTATVATSQSEAKLRAYERAHVCDRQWTYRTTQGYLLQSDGRMSETGSSTRQRDRQSLLTSQASRATSRQKQ